MRPWLKPALRRIWRDPRTVQFGVGPAHAALVHPRSPGESALLDLLDGTRELPDLVERAAGLGVAEDEVHRLLAELVQARALDDAAEQEAVLAGSTGQPELPPSALGRLGPELAALSLVRPEPDGGAAALAARRDAWVRVHGAGRVGAALGAQLAAAGVGRVEVVDGGRVAPADPLPGGVRPADVGRLRASAAAEAVRRASPAEPSERRRRRAAAASAAGWATAAGSDGPGLVVVAPRGVAGAWAPDPELSGRLVESGVPHLYAGVVETVGTVGPLVLPGESPCGRCLSLHRAAVDPDWPRVLAQLCSARAGGPDSACAGALAAGVAALAALHALILLDGGSPPSVGGMLELSMADGAVRRRPLSAHPDCGCRWTIDGPSDSDGDADFHRIHGAVRTGERV
jgi:bacteriocin biosynthesis cyclodehydratase domain-containing protein